MNFLVARSVMGLNDLSNGVPNLLDAVVKDIRVVSEPNAEDLEVEISLKRRTGESFLFYLRQER